MERRVLLKGLAALPVAASIPAQIFARKQTMKVIKPNRLRPGDTVGVIAPSSGVSESTFESGLENIASLGFKTKVGRYARGGKGFLSGTDSERLHDIHWAFQDSEVKAVWCIRGGYGASRLLDKIDYGLIKRNPKIVIGYSDVTALLIAIYQKTGLVTFHGPVAASNYTDYTREHVLRTLTRRGKKQAIDLPPVPEEADPELYKTIVINGGSCTGRLVGGNLSLIAAMNGTPHGLRNPKGKILFLEDVSEAPYRVDRMLTQMKQTIDVSSFEGIALGVFTRTENDLDSPSQSMIEVFRERLGGLGIPVIYGLSFGHIRDQFTIPLGVRANLETSVSRLTLLESPVK